MRFAWYSAISMFCFKYLYAQKTFEVKLQSGRMWSKDEWVEHNAKVPHLKEFSACHWEKRRYMSTSLDSIWAYCSVNTSTHGDFKCVQLWSEGNVVTANRNLHYRAWFSGWGDRTLDSSLAVISYKHRSWNHICWTYSSITGVNRLYHNGMLAAEKVLENTEEYPSISGRDAVYDDAFIIGQEPDSMRGGFAARQAFYGSISELHLWDNILKENDIQNLAACNGSMKGNVLRWEKQYLNVFKATVIDVQDIGELCRKDQTFVIFPTPQRLHSAFETCKVHGGEIVLPQTIDENNKILDVIKVHKHKCMNGVQDTDGPIAIWLGLQNFRLHTLNENGTYHKTLMPFSNWGEPYQKLSVSYKDIVFPCAFMTSHGQWGLTDSMEYCKSIELCTICSIAETPVFTLKGLCNNGAMFDWNYYFVPNNLYQIGTFESYKRSQKIISKDGNWQLTVAGANIELKGSDSPIGRKKWRWNDSACKNYNLQQRNLTFSICNFGKEFTCSNGYCVSMQSRCNGINNCLDGSDEERCNQLEIPNSYSKIDPPPPEGKVTGRGKNMEYTHVQTNIIIENIDFIDAANMKMGMTMELQMNWKDTRLMFKNISPGVRRLVTDEVKEKLWLPIDHIKHGKSIIGMVRPGPEKRVDVYTETAPLPVEVFRSFEDFQFNASECHLNAVQRFRIDYTCKFNLNNYPFDQHTCKFYLGIDSTEQNRVTLVGTDHSFCYIGDSVVNQFQILSTTSNTVLNCNQNQTGLKERRCSFEINLKRNSSTAVKMIFIPSCMLWFLAYLTLLLDVEDFTNRNRISVTLLLAMVTLFGSTSMNEDFPQTSYFKDIDAWFSWFLTNIFLVISHHIFIEKLKGIIGEDNGQVSPYIYRDSASDSHQLPRRYNKIKCINRVAMAFFLFAMTLFITIYFSCSMPHI